jgi:hypothetical protein
VSILDIHDKPLLVPTNTVMGDPDVPEPVIHVLTAGLGVAVPNIASRPDTVHDNKLPGSGDTTSLIGFPDVPFPVIHVPEVVYVGTGLGAIYRPVVRHSTMFPTSPEITGVSVRAVVLPFPVIWIQGSDNETTSIPPNVRPDCVIGSKALTTHAHPELHFLHFMVLLDVPRH